MAWQRWIPALYVAPRRVSRTQLQPSRITVMVIRRRTISLLGSESPRRQHRPQDALPSTTDLDIISRSNWKSWRALIRVLAITLSLISIGCIAWAYATGPRAIIDHYVSDGQDVPWVLIPVSFPFSLYPPSISSRQSPS